MIVLASSSKRRSAILNSCGITHKVVPSSADEYMDVSRFPHKIVMLNACIKAEAVAEKFKAGYIIGADTVCLLDGKIIGKPRNERHAREMLRQMSGKTIAVYTGLCIIDLYKKKAVCDYEKSLVKVKDINKKDIPRLFKLLGPYDKAGGFSIEGVGSFIFDDIKGSYFNVLGLPMIKLKEMFEKLDIDILKFSQTRRVF